MPAVARYDGVADWYERELAASPFAVAPRETALRLLGPGPGRLLDVGCGTGSHTIAFVGAGWRVTGADLSADQLRLARARGLDVVQADAAALPFEDDSFDAVVSLLTHTDMDDFRGALVEIGRVLRTDGTFVYLGVHPCFIGPHARFERLEGLPELHDGYRTAGRYATGPGVSPHGLRAKVGAVHLPLGELVQAFLDTGFRIERFEEAGDRAYPHLLALRCRR